jgi:hypothetical protein
MAALKGLLGRAWALATLAVLSLVGVGCEEVGAETGPTVSRDEMFTVGAAPRVVVESFNGAVTVEAGPAGSVRVRATVRGTAVIQYTVEETEDGVTATAEQTSRGPFFGRSPGVDMLITAPPDAVLALETSNGGIEVRGVGASGTLRTSNGPVEMADVQGDFEIETSNGRVTLSRVSGSFSAETSNGAITLSGGLALGSENALRTSNGSVTVELLGTPSVRLDATTSNGEVRSGLPITATQTSSTRLEGTIGDGEASLMIRTSNGDVTVR